MITSFLVSAKAWIIKVIVWLGRFIWKMIKDNPGGAFAAIYGFGRLFGTTIQTGEKGVRFYLGKADRELDPGYHWLIPLLQIVKKVKNRQHTINLTNEVVCGADSLVWMVDVNAVYEIESPTASIIQTEDAAKAMSDIAPLACQRLIRARNREQMKDTVSLDDELTAELNRTGAIFGLRFLHAGFQSITPSVQSLRITQLESKSRERLDALRMMSADLPEAAALGLLGSTRQLVARERIRRRRDLRRIRVGR